MVDIFSTNNTTLFDETGTYSMDVDSDEDAHAKAKIWDGTNTAEVTSLNRLKTQTTISSVPATPVEYKTVNLLNGASPEQTVNGSVTPVEFAFTPGTGETWYVEEITFIISDGGAPTENTYGALTALTNGTDLKVKSAGTTITIGNMKNNMDIIMTFSDESWDPSSFMSVKLYKGTIVFHNAFEVGDANSDYIKMIVNDDLTGLNYQRGRIKLWRETS